MATSWESSSRSPRPSAQSPPRPRRAAGRGGGGRRRPPKPSKLDHGAFGGDLAAEVEIDRRAAFERRVEMADGDLAGVTPCSFRTSRASRPMCPGAIECSATGAPVRRCASATACSTRSSTGAMRPDETPISPIRPQGTPSSPSPCRSATSPAARSATLVAPTRGRQNRGDVVAATGHHVHAAAAGERNERGVVAAELVGCLVHHRATAGRGEQESSAAICSRSSRRRLSRKASGSRRTRARFPGPTGSSLRRARRPRRRPRPQAASRGR